jgi:hypothetical protein
MPIPGAQITRVSPKDRAASFGVGIYRAAYDQGLNVSQLLQREDPDDLYKEDEVLRHLDAFERVLYHAGIRTRWVPELGWSPSTWEEATKTAELRAMMPEWASRIYRNTVYRRLQPVSPSDSLPTVDKGRAILLAGDAALNTLANQYQDNFEMRATRLAPPIPLASIVARTTPITTDAYRTLYVIDALGTDAYRMKRVVQGTDIPTTTLVTGEHTMRIHKYGRAILTTYEQLRRMTIDRIGFLFARMAVQTEADKVGEVIGIIVAGDGNANTAAVVLNQTALDVGSAAGALTLRAWLTAKIRFTVAYRADTVIAQEVPTLQLLLLPFNTINGTPLLAEPSPRIGTIVPINDQFGGAIQYGVSADAPALKMVLFDSTQTVEQVVEVGGNVAEVDRFIRDQTQLFTITEVVGYGIIDPNAARVVNVNA